ncbi:MAG: hypothetical protein WAK60_11980 [Sedimentisphaerales bacterium]
MKSTMTPIPVKCVKSVRVTHKKAVALINDKAARDYRSAGSTAALVIIEHLGGSNDTSNASAEQEKNEVGK